jgi:hypothetical protein
MAEMGFKEFRDGCRLGTIVLEFEPIYREEAKARQVRKPKDLSCINDTEHKGVSRSFMARDAGAGEQSIARVLSIRAHDPKRFITSSKGAGDAHSPAPVSCWPVEQGDPGSPGPVGLGSPRLSILGHPGAMFSRESRPIGARGLF